MSFKIYVANLPVETSSTELEELFSEVGVVEQATIMSREELELDATEEVQPFFQKYGYLGQFGLVEMPSLGEAKAAVMRFHKVELPSKPGFVLRMSGPHGPGKKP